MYSSSTERTIAASIDHKAAGVYRPESAKLLISACLAGIECRYDGQAYAMEAAVDLLTTGRAIAICPEVLGGLPTPRERAERKDGRVMTASGQDVTAAFAAGAKAALRLALQAGCKRAILKSKSPSCGCGRIYDGTFTGCLVDGDGIFCAMLTAAGIAVDTEAVFMGDDNK